MNLNAILRMIRWDSLDAKTCETLLRAAEGEQGEEIDAAINALAFALGVIDEEGQVREQGVEALMDDLGMERDHPDPHDP
ncbi:MAG: hypothetical protein ACP5GX_06780 [Anaerolineae bacterium]